MSIENTKVPVTTELPILSKERNVSKPNEVKQPIVIENKEEEKEKINDKEETKKTNLLFAKKNISPIHLICHLSGKFEIFLMIIGIIGSFGTGIAAPLMTYLFGDLLGDFSSFTSIALTTLPPEQVNVLFSEFQDTVDKMVREILYIGVGVFVSAFLMYSMWNYVGLRQIYHLKEKYFYHILRQEQGWFDANNAFEIPINYVSKILYYISNKNKFIYHSKSFILLGISSICVE